MYMLFGVFRKGMPMLGMSESDIDGRCVYVSQQSLYVSFHS
jgi:hypothetical protein